MGYHAINEGSSITVYRIAGCPSDEIIGTLYNGEVFTVIGEHQGYGGNYEIRYLDSNGNYRIAFIDSGQYGNLAYSGKRVTESALGNACYRFKLRKSLKVVDSNGNQKVTLPEEPHVEQVILPICISLDIRKAVPQPPALLVLSPSIIRLVLCSLRTSACIMHN